TIIVSLLTFHFSMLHVCIFLFPFSIFFLFLRIHCFPTLFSYTTLFRSPGSRHSKDRSSRPAIPACRRCAICTASPPSPSTGRDRSEEHTSELQSRFDLVCRPLLEKKKSRMESVKRYRKSMPYYDMMYIE